jgi:nucleotide-binding universal stress UspA family protein
MFSRILVPLDGSKLSEASLPAAAEFAIRFDAQVILLHVIERDAPAEVHKERHLTDANEASRYLKEVAARGFVSGSRVESHVHDIPVTDVARSIVEHAAGEFQADFIVTCTHGRSGMRDLLYGSIAQRIVAQGRLPLLLIKPDPREFEIRKILVPLDPGSAHDASIEPAASVAAAFHAEIQLLSVIPTLGSLTGEEAATTSLMPLTAQAMLELQQEQSDQHLQEHRSALQQRGLVSTALTARGEPAAQIVNVADRGAADLIVLSTHRKTGLGAFWSKSVAPRVAQSTKKPLLLVPLE